MIMDSDKEMENTATIDQIDDANEFIDFSGEEVTIDSQSTPLAEEEVEYLEFETEDSVQETDSPTNGDDVNSHSDDVILNEMVVLDDTIHSIESEMDETQCAVDAIQADLQHDEITEIDPEIDVDEDDEDDDDSENDEHENCDEPNELAVESDANRINENNRERCDMVQETVEHTVNLLNNNKILIKSVKSASSSSASPVSTKSEASTKSEKQNINSSLSTAKPCEKEDLKSIEIDTTITSKIDGQKSQISPAPKMKREFEQLQKTVNESKILTEFIFDRNTRGRRTIKSTQKQTTQSVQQNDAMATDKSNNLTNVNSINTQSNEMGVDQPDKDENEKLVTPSTASKRNTRSRNSDFSAKRKRFMKDVIKESRGSDDDADDSENSFDSDDENETKSYVENNETSERTLAVDNDKQTDDLTTKQNEKHKKDLYCWRCHQDGCQISCSMCIRSYHLTCVKIKQSALQELDKWQCFECTDLSAAEHDEKKKFDANHLTKLLKFVMDRITSDQTLGQFQFLVNRVDFTKQIVNPIDLTEITKKIMLKKYTTTEAFLSDVRWILHNCSIVYPHNYKMLNGLKTLVKVCKSEMFDIETCAECYYNANTLNETWFTEACAKPHLILWAKLKGFPYWPAKAMTVNANLVDVRFFGEHDRAYVPAKDCFLYSRQDPNPPTAKYKRNSVADCMKEASVYIANVITKFGSFNYANFKTPFNPLMEEKHLQEIIPGYRKHKSSKSSYKNELKLCIVKTADNHLSVVKKYADRNSSPAKSTTSEDTSSTASMATPTTSNKKRKSDLKSNKLNGNESNGNAIEKQYQILRRKSMVNEKEPQKKVSTVILKRKSMNVAHDEENQHQNQRTETPVKRVKSLESVKANKKRSRSSERPKSRESNRSNEPIADEKLSTIDESKNNFEADGVNGILASVGLSRVVPQRAEQSNERKEPKIEGDEKEKREVKEKEDKNQPSQTTIKKKHESPTSDAENDSSSSSSIQVENSSKIALVPFIELKEEPREENPHEMAPVDETASAEEFSSSQQDLLQHELSQQESNASSQPELTSTPTEPTRISSEVEKRINEIKIEPNSSDDEAPLAIDETVGNSRETSQVREPIDERPCGSISLCDINKLTAPRARKTFPRMKISLPSSSSSSQDFHRSRSVTSNNKRPRPPPAMNNNNMVYIPMDSNALPRMSSDLMPSISTAKATAPPLPTPSMLQSQLTQTTTSNSIPIPAGSSLLISTTAQTNSLPLITSQAHHPTTAPPSYQSSIAQPLSTIASGMLTEQMAAAVADTIIRAPPKLTCRPAAPLRSDGNVLFPSEAGNVCRTLMENAHRMTDFFRSVIEDTLSDMANMTCPEARIKLLEMEIEKLKHAHAKEIIELKTNTDTMLNEMKKSMEKERIRLINETRKQCEIERTRSVEETKRKQWCVQCGKEAQFYCCWNTSYCGYPCQQQHWPNHMKSCGQIESNKTDNANVRNNRRESLQVNASKNIDSRQQQLMKNVTSLPKEHSISLIAHPGRSLPPEIRNMMQSKNPYLQRFANVVSTNSSVRQQQQLHRSHSSNNFTIIGSQNKFDIFNQPPSTAIASSTNATNARTISMNKQPMSSSLIHSHKSFPSMQIQSTPITIDRNNPKSGNETIIISTE